MLGLELIALQNLALHQPQLSLYYELLCLAVDARLLGVRELGVEG